MSGATASLEPASCAAELVRQLDTIAWTPGLDDGAVQVFFSDHTGAGVRGYRTVTHHDASLEVVAAFLGHGILSAFKTLNARFAFGETLVDDPWIVRTGFTMPTGFSSREFVHALIEHRLDAHTHIVAYMPVDESGLPAPRDGFLRCPIFPSGQRITQLDDGRTRVEHVMTYWLGGRIGPWVQTHVFHRGHLGAYQQEWTRMVEHFAKAVGHA